jgi:hypothetical protein
MAKKNINENITSAPSSEEILNQMKYEAPKTGNVNSEISDLLSGYKEKIEIDEPSAIQNEKGKRGRKPKNAQPEPQQVITETPVITGALMMMLIDLALPHLMVFANNKLNKKGKKIRASDLQMTSEQRKELEPVADQVAKEMMLQANPLTVLIISMIGIYGINFMMLKSDNS